MKTIDDFEVAGQRVLVRDDFNVPLDGARVADDGPESARLFTASIRRSRTVFWNGPMGVFELAQYANGTRAISSALASSEAFTVIGGGDTGAAIRALGFPDSAFGYISTGGGATLEFIRGKVLPGLAALEHP